MMDYDQREELHRAMTMTDDRKRNTGGEWGSPEFYVAELAALCDAMTLDKAKGVCNGAVILIERQSRALAESRAECERLRTKYVAAIDEIGAQSSERAFAEARAEQLAVALQIAYRHIDITGLRVSHCKDAAAIDAALNLEPRND